MFDPNSPIMQKIKSARSLKDMRQILNQILGKNKDLEKIPTKILKSISNRVTEIGDIGGDLGDLEGDIGSPRSKNKPKSLRFKRNLETFKNVDIKQLQNNSKTLERFAQEIAELEAMKNSLASGMFASLPKTKELLKSVDASLKEAKASRNKQLKAMSLAISKKPKDVKKIVANVTEHLNTILTDDLYSEQTQHSFLFVPEGRTDIVWYQTYLTFHDLLSSEDFVFDVYTIVLTSSVNLSDGSMDHFLTTLKSDAMPGSFDPGREITTGSKAKQLLNTFLAADDFNINFSRRRNIQGKVGTGRFSRTEDIKDAMRGKQLGGSAIRKVSEHVDNMRIQNDQIYFRLVKGVDSYEIKEATDQIKTAVKDLYGAKRAKGIVHKIEQSKGRTFVVVALLEDSTKLQSMIDNVDRMGVRLGMNRTEISKFKQFVAREL